MTDRRRVLAVLSALLMTAAVAVAKQKLLVNTDPSGVVLHGYDTVSYFTEHAAVKGDERYKVTYKGGTYYFASDTNKKRFETAPTKYAPQYGGYCAVAVSMGQLEDADPRMFTIHNDKLLVQRNEKAHQMFMSNPDAIHQKADQQWPALVEKNGR